MSVDDFRSLFGAWHVDMPCIPLLMATAIADSVSSPTDSCVDVVE